MLRQGFWAIQGEPKGSFWISRRNNELIDWLREQLRHLHQGEDATQPESGALRTPAQFLHFLNHAEPPSRLMILERLREDAERGNACTVANHEAQIYALKRRIAILTGEDVENDGDTGQLTGGQARKENPGAVDADTPSVDLELHIDDEMRDLDCLAE